MPQLADSIPSRLWFPRPLPIHPALPQNTPYFIAGHLTYTQKGVYLLCGIYSVPVVATIYTSQSDLFTRETSLPIRLLSIISQRCTSSPICTARASFQTRSTR